MTETTPGHETIIAALAAAQAEILDPEKNQTAEVYSKRTNKTFTFKYADLAQVLKTGRPILAKHGIATIQKTKIKDGNLVLKTILLHTSGQKLSSEYPVCSINENHQAMGGAMTYAKRQNFTALIAMSASDDVDGADAALAGSEPRRKMSAHEAKGTLDWDKVQDKLDTAKDLQTCFKQRAWVESKKNDWPDSYISSAYERIGIRELQLADEMFALSMTIEAVDGLWADLEKELAESGRIPWEELAGMYHKHQERFEGDYA